MAKIPGVKAVKSTCRPDNFDKTLPDKDKHPATPVVTDMCDTGFRQMGKRAGMTGSMSVFMDLFIK